MDVLRFDEKSGLLRRSRVLEEEMSLCCRGARCWTEDSRARDMDGDLSLAFQVSHTNDVSRGRAMSRRQAGDRAITVDSRGLITGEI